MFERFKQRSHEPERLDTGDYTPAEYSRWEREMNWVHAMMGERRALNHTLLREIRALQLKEVVILDIGSGSGGILKYLMRMLPDVRVVPIAAEFNEIALTTMRKESGSTGILPLKADGLNLPFPDGSVDYAVCTLILHHLTDEQATGLVSEMDRVSGRGFFAVDLNRHPVGYYGYRLLSPLFFQKFTQEDGALSVLKSFTPNELLDVAEAAGVKDPKVTHSPANRLVLSRK